MRSILRTVSAVIVGIIFMGMVPAEKTQDVSLNKEPPVILTIAETQKFNAIKRELEYTAYAESVTTVEPDISEDSDEDTSDDSEVPLSREEIELIALVVMAEAEGESELGKRLVIDTILNRVDDGRFPNTVNDVIYQKNQFTSMTNGRVDRCYVKNDICELVVEEALSRTNYEVFGFTAGGYMSYGTPLLQEGGHYFVTL